MSNCRLSNKQWMIRLFISLSKYKSMSLVTFIATPKSHGFSSFHSQGNRAVMMEVANADLEGVKHSNSF